MKHVVVYAPSHCRQLRPRRSQRWLQPQLIHHPQPLNEPGADAPSRHKVRCDPLQQCSPLASQLCVETLDHGEDLISASLATERGNLRCKDGYRGVV
mmetsp:Transcript_113669/g.208959  ORF Transcript_113669/g.208959 Transcript_113669/m.208959 type:complete len:97 (-) Transcript_113669:487-777(-)